MTTAPRTLLVISLLLSISTNFAIAAADQPTPRTDANSLRAHEDLLAKARRGGIDLYFVGDSITRRWGTSDAQYAAMLANWNENFFGWNADALTLTCLLLFMGA
ncbi:MAG: hypothetical protein NTV51_13715, partial [Verrucomicrobia bacterium]|nr:hypothetical protein [Verrucomicrobiota bacterium]